MIHIPDMMSSDGLGDCYITVLVSPVLTVIDGHIPGLVTGEDIMVHG